MQLVEWSTANLWSSIVNPGSAQEHSQYGRVVGADQVVAMAGSGAIPVDSFASL